MRVHIKSNRPDLACPFDKSNSSEGIISRDRVWTGNHPPTGAVPLLDQSLGSRTRRIIADRPNSVERGNRYPKQLASRRSRIWDDLPTRAIPVLDQSCRNKRAVR